MIRFEPLNAANYEAFKALAEQAWRRPATEAYYRWRYFEAPAKTTLLAMEGERCVATISWFEKIYRGAHGSVACLEPFDWYALPETRRSAAGLRLMKQLQKTGRPIIGLGGSDHTLVLLPKLGFRNIGEASLYVLPLTGTYLLRDARLPPLARRAVSGLLDSAVSAWFRPSTLSAGRGFETRRLPRIDDELARIAGPAALASLPDPAYFDWLEKGASVGGATGRYIPMEMREDGKPVAWGIGRLFRHSGVLHGTIIDFRTTRNEPRIAEAGIREMTRILARAGADNVRVWSMLPLCSEAYRRAGFRLTSARAPAMVWSRSDEPALDGAHLACVADAAFFPLHQGPADAISATATRALASRPRFT